MSKSKSFPKDLHDLIKNLDPSWKSLLKAYVNTSDFETLNQSVCEAYQETTCYPAFEHILSAFEYFKTQETKVIILGQDPYHQPGQAEGLAFSVPKEIKTPRSLVNIYKELNNNYLEFNIPNHGNLINWAKQGVLLLNTVLTVEHDKANSHKKIGWVKFTDYCIQAIADLPHPKVFALWGNAAKSKAKLIKGKQNLILEAAHPSPLGANRGGWFGEQHFKKINDFLLKHKNKTIEWDIN